MDADTIASVSTAPGPGAIAVVRVSGPGAIGILRRITPERGVDPAARTATLTRICDPSDGSAIDRAVVTVFPAPDSYTGDDVVEVSCHGGLLIPELVLEACLEAGARRAEPGEFTRRAYLRGKLDLVQAEAVADLIDAGSRALHRAALFQLEQGLSARLAELRTGVVRVEALLVHHLDFPEEDEPPVPIGRVASEANGIVAEIDTLLSTAPEGELLREGALVVLAGRPNAGKSSLYNALLGRERAIVTAEAGTTRDALEAPVQIGGYPFRIVDTAGLRQASGEVERLGIEVAHQFLDEADLILLCVPPEALDVAAELALLADRVRAPVLWLRTKADLLSDDGGGVDALGAEAADAIRVSTMSGEGLDVLKQAMPSAAYAGVVEAKRDAPVITNRRHARGLRVAREEILAFADGLLGGLPPEVAASHLRSAEGALEELLGVVSVDDVLDVVFREFCIGK